MYWLMCVSYIIYIYVSLICLLFLLYYTYIERSVNEDIRREVQTSDAQWVWKVGYLNLFKCFI